MPKETASHINQLVATNPDGADPKTQGDDHIRMIKQVLLTDFPNIAGAVTADHTELSYCDGVTSAIQTQLNAKAPLASPALTGVPTVPTAAADTNTTQAASTAFVLGQVGTASPAMNGVATVGASLRYSRQDHIHPSDTSRGALAGNNTWTGSNAFNVSPTVPVPETSDNSSKIAPTSYVVARIAQDVPIATSSTLGRTRLASVAESQTLWEGFAYLTPYTLDQAYRGGNQGAGWQRLPGGRIEQWAYTSLGDISDGTAGSITFPVTFSSGTLGFSLTGFDSAVNGYFSVVVTGYSNSSISYRINEYAGVTQNARLYLRVIGE